MQLEGKSVVLKEFTEQHLQDPRYLAWLRDFDIVIPIYRLEYLMPLQFAEIEQYARTMMSSKNDCFFAIHHKDSNEFIGTLRIGHINWRSGVADIGIIIGEKKYWGKGLAAEAVTTACEYAFTTLSLFKLTGGTPGSNTAMCKCFSKAGFVQEGRLRKQLLINGDHIDHVLFGLLKEDFAR